MIYRIADFNVDIKYSYPNNDIFLADYLYAEADRVDFSVEITEQDIDFEVNNAVRTENVLRFSRGYLERLAILRKVSAEVLSHGAFLIHGALIEHEGRGYLFCAPSGIGKTTHILLWQQLFGAEKVRIINGDKPIVRMTEKGFLAYGTPWCGKEGYNINTHVSLSAVCFIRRGTQNSISKADETDALQKILSQIMVADSTDLARQLELVGRLIETVPVYELSCNMDIEAARVAYEGMKEY